MSHIILADSRRPADIISEAENAFKNFGLPKGYESPLEVTLKKEYDPTHALKLLAKTVEVYWKSKGANDGLMIIRTLENKEVEISGNGMYMTCSQKQFDELMEIFNKL